MRWFTVEVRPAWRVLIAAPADLRDRRPNYALFLSEAIAPRSIRLKGEAAFECEVVRERRTGQATARGRGGRVPGRSASRCRRGLAEAGLLCFRRRRVGDLSGPQCDARRFVQRAEPPKSCCPASWCGNGAADETFLAPTVFEHPLLAKFRAVGELGAVGRPADLSALATRLACPRKPGSLLSYSNDQPALARATASARGAC